MLLPNLLPPHYHSSGGRSSVSQGPPQDPRCSPRPIDMDEAQEQASSLPRLLWHSSALANSPTALFSSSGVPGAMQCLLAPCCNAASCLARPLVHTYQTGTLSEQLLTRRKMTSCTSKQGWRFPSPGTLSPSVGPREELSWTQPATKGHRAQKQSSTGMQKEREVVYTQCFHSLPACSESVPSPPLHAEAPIPTHTSPYVIRGLVPSTAPTGNKCLFSGLAPRLEHVRGQLPAWHGFQVH